MELPCVGSFRVWWHSFCSKSLLGVKRPRKRGKNSPKWSSRPLQWPPGGFPPVRRVKQIHPDLVRCLCFSPTFLRFLSGIISYLSFWRIKKRKREKSCSDFVENSLFGPVTVKSTTRELYIWVPVPDDVKTGTDPKLAAQRVPQRGRLCAVFPSCASVTSSCRGEPQGPIWGGPGPEHWGLSTANSNYPDRAGGGGGSLDPQQAPLTALNFTFHTASCVTGEPSGVILRTRFVVWFKAKPDRNLGSAAVSELQPAC